MEMLNKLKSTVGGFIGNPVTREYEIIRHVGSGGPGCLWKIYQAVKRSTKQEAGVFVFEKKLLERFAKRDREQVLELLKKGSTQLTRLRHPCVLTVQHPLEESRESLAFATEPVFASLANILGCRDNMPSPVPPDIGDHKLFEVEMKYGLLQLTDSLKFLHNDVRMIHGNICPSSIILNGNGAWKLAGFDFVIPSTSPPDQPPSFSVREIHSNVAAILQPNLNYLAPEYLLTQSCDTASDMFSLGMLMYATLNEGKTLHDCNGNVSTFRQKSEQLKSLNINTLRSLPDGLREYVKMLLSTTPTIRPDADQLAKIPFFDDMGAMTLQYLDSLFQQDNQQKAQFFKGLPKVLSKLPKRVVQQRVLPCLCKEFMNPDMVPFVLPNVLLIAEDCSDAEYVKLVLPSLKNVFKMQEPVQILLIFMQRMNLLLSKTPAEDIKDHVLPMVYRALESSSVQIQELCLNILPSFVGMIEYTSLKHSIIPRIKKLCLDTNLLSVRVGCLVSIGKMLEHMDKWFVLDEIMPLLAQIPSREPAVLMAMLGIVKVTMTHKKLGITKDMAATKVLPFLFPLCIDNNLNLNQFNAYMAVITDLIRLVEKEQRVKLEQLHTLQEEQKTSVEFAQKLQSNGSVGNASAGGESKTSGGSGVDQMFESFGLNGHGATGSGNPTNQGSSLKGKAVDQAPVRPGGVSLSLQEKQRLQQDQEFQQRLKTQKQIQPAAGTKSAGNDQQLPGSAAKDLTSSLVDNHLGSLGLSNIGGSKTGGSSLLDNNFGQLGSSSTLGGPQSSTSSPTSGSSSMMGLGSNAQAGGSAGIGLGSTSQSMFSSGSSNIGTSAPLPFSQGSTTASYGMSNASMLSQPMRMQGQPQVGQSQAKKSVDMSAFDTLLGPSQAQHSRKSLNDMSIGGHSKTSGVGSGRAFGGGNQGALGQLSQGQNCGSPGQGGQGQMSQGQGQMSLGQAGQGAFAQLGSGHGVFMPAQSGGMGNFNQGVRPMGQTPWAGNAMSGQQGGQNSSRVGVGFDPFASSKPANQQKPGNQGLMDFLG